MPHQSRRAFVAGSVGGTAPAFDLRLSPSLPAPSVYLSPYKAWLERALGCELAQTVVLRLPVPYGDFILEDFLRRTPLARAGRDADGGAAAHPVEEGPLLGPGPFASQARTAAGGTYVPDREVGRSLILHGERAPGEPVELDAEPVRERVGDATRDRWSVQWRGPAFALWCKGLRHAMVFVSVPFVSLHGGLHDAADLCVVINAEERAEVLHLLRSAFVAAPNMVQVIGGRHIRLAHVPYDWSRLVLSAKVLEQVRDDFEAFLARRRWFRDHDVAYKRGYLFYGPPGNGKTSLIKLMAAHPDIQSFSLDFSNEDLTNEALTDLFEVASRNQPSLVLFEDLDRLYAPSAWRHDDNRTRITLQHLLNAIDGVGTREGVIVVATANDVGSLDPALTQRPGRFDRVIYLGPPDMALRLEYLRRLKVAKGFSDDELRAVAEGT